LLQRDESREVVFSCTASRAKRGKGLGLRQVLGALLLLSYFLPAASGVAGQQPTMPPARVEELRKRLQLSFAGVAAEDSPGFAVLVKQEGQALFEEGFGVRDLRGKRKIDAHTNFRLASCTKQFTAMAIMLLVHGGKLRYDETLMEVFPEFPAYGASITVRNLLNHTSGLPDYEDLMDAAEKAKGPMWSPERQIRDDQVLQLLKKESHGKFAPGSQWEYSNSGYVLLGLIVAKRSGMPFGDFLHERIFAPLKMEHTVVFEKGKNEIAARAYGHLPAILTHGSQKTYYRQSDQSATSATEGDGGVYSNLEDLSKWDDALRNHTLLSEKEFAAAVTPASLPARAEPRLASDVPESLRQKAASYGFGWFLDLNNPHPLMWHYGDTMGFRTAILRYLDSNLTVIALSNRSDLDAGALALEAAAVVGNSP
jgi:CubicO group peptidase (beta-lactamase class C family)